MNCRACAGSTGGGIKVSRVVVLFKSVQKELDATQEESQEKDDSIAQLEKEANALLALYNLQQEYAAGNLDGCRVTLQEISDQGLEELLPKTAPDGITAPAQRYQELREAILNA